MTELPEAKVRQDPNGRKLALQIAALVAIVVGTVGGIVVLGLLDISFTSQIVLQMTVGVGGLGAALSRASFRRWLAAISIDQWRAIDAETDRSTPDPNPHIRVLVVLLACAISLTIQEYVGGADKYELWFPYDGGEYWELIGFVWWTGWRVIGYVIIPLVVIACLPGERFADYHIRGRGFFKHLWIYAVMFVAFSPIVIIASLSDSFRETYPFYRMANRSQIDLWSWEVLYVIQFIALEFFFRGFLLQALRRVMGANAIFVMMIPYCMIHFGKPMAETFGAIGAGLVLGTLAMRTGSIWGGVLIHTGVAISMDVLALRGCPPMGSDSYCHP
jgi:membrane protease YdiL (CAAX protease family)